MPEIYSLVILVIATVLFGWMIQTLIRQVKDSASAAAQSHILASIERERCERIREECRELRSECNISAAAAHDAMADAEMFTESVDPGDESDDPDDDDDAPYRPGY